LRWLWPSDLAGLKNLGRLLLRDTRVSKAGIAQLREALSSCMINH
jgi:hypothetical protein